MKSNYDVGVVGCWYWGNYGSLLNGYSTYQILGSFNLKVLNIVTPNNGFELHSKKFFDIVYRKKNISPVLPFNRVNEFNGICDFFLTGSDQIWKFKSNENPEYAEFFRLNFVNYSKKKISFATSFGNYIPESEEHKEKFKKLFGRYNAISVREEQAVNILRERYGMEATQIMEPILSVDKNIWFELSEYSKYKKETEPYLLTYILDPSPDKRKAIQYYSKKIGMKVINILDGFAGKYKKNIKLLDLQFTLPNISCMDFLKYFINSSFVITDSFHGTAFSLIFNKPFISISNFGRGIERFNNLLSKVDLMDRLVDNKNIPEDIKYLTNIDFNYANEIVSLEKERAINWLKEKIMEPNNPGDVCLKKDVTYILNKKLCMGCGACLSICPVKAVNLVKDDYGYYRSNVDYSKCTNCGLCRNVCAALELPKNGNKNTPKAYAFINSDIDIVLSSSSGGVFSVLADFFIKKQGFVSGAAWNNNFCVEHIMVKDEDGLKKLRKSKYLQSYLGCTFNEVKNLINQGNFVLFSGLPCQAAGLKAYLGEDHKNLLIIDLLCGNCPSSDFFNKYLDENFKRNDIAAYYFRYKLITDVSQSKNQKRILVESKNGNNEIHDKEDFYQKLYHSQIMAPEHCRKCIYQGLPRFGDLTIGDSWGIQKYYNSIDQSKGVSVILINNNKGKKYLKKFNKRNIAILKNLKLKEIMKYNVLAFQKNRKWPDNLKNKLFYEVYKNTKSFNKAYFAVDNLKKNTQKSGISILNLKNESINFIFDGKKWEQKYIENKVYLNVKDGFSKYGIRAYLPITEIIKKNHKYKLTVKFDIITKSSEINLHLYNTKSKIKRVILNQKLKENKSNIERTIIFSTDMNDYDSFMVGAMHIKGENNYISFNYIFIEEVYPL